MLVIPIDLTQVWPPQPGGGGDEPALTASTKAKRAEINVTYAFTVSSRLSSNT